MNLLVAVSSMLQGVGNVVGVGGGKGFNTEWPTLVLFLVWLPRNLSNYMDRQARNRDTVLVSCREMTGRSQTLPWWLERGKVKTTEKSIGQFGIAHVCVMSRYVIRLLSTPSKPAPLSQILSYTHPAVHCLRFFS